LLHNEALQIYGAGSHRLDQNLQAGVHHRSSTDVAVTVSLCVRMRIQRLSSTKTCVLLLRYVAICCTGNRNNCGQLATSTGKKMKMNGPIKHAVGIYGLPSVNNNKSKTSDNVTGIMKKVDSMEINDKDEDFKSEENKITQGDRLNEIKAQRAKAKQPLVTNL
jgi:hypothetical protein